MDLSNDEKQWIRKFIQLNHPALLDEAEALGQAVEFSRAFFKSELHAETYTRVRTRCSTNIEVVYTNGADHGVVHKFLKVTLANTTFRLALITTYRRLPASALGVVRINRNQPYKDGKIIEVASIERKVMFVGGPNPTSVLPVPHKRSS